MCRLLLPKLGLQHEERNYRLRLVPPTRRVGFYRVIVFMRLLDMRRIGGAIFN
jgi:hypothetical protein